MIFFNPVMRSVNGWSESPGLFPAVISRTLAVFVAVPLEILVVIENIVKAPLYLLSSLVKLSIKAINLMTRSKMLSQLDEKIPGCKMLLEAAFNIGKYVPATLSTFFLGVVSPGLNFHYHLQFGLVKDAKLLPTDKLNQDERNEPIENELLLEVARRLKSVNAEIDNQSPSLNVDPIRPRRCSKPLTNLGTPRGLSSTPSGGPLSTPRGVLNTPGAIVNTPRPFATPIPFGAYVVNQIGKMRDTAGES